MAHTPSQVLLPPPLTTARKPRTSATSHVQQSAAGHASSPAPQPSPAKTSASFRSPGCSSRGARTTTSARPRRPRGRGGAGRWAGSSFPAAVKSFRLETNCDNSVPRRDSREPARGEGRELRCCSAARSPGSVEGAARPCSDGPAGRAVTGSREGRERPARGWFSLLISVEVNVRALLRAPRCAPGVAIHRMLTCKAVTETGPWN
ncbi:PREDICTED: uncharacterized protein LOC105988445 [Dipodomys ordii]|uniref:Uncharacterized protein LOC105988445 n=1 Tax=Dipodomys ordii TaxID=10020 RepID=A0A1S3FGV4_DIPOR|nr:PREDICTED: uncharacterized protein LOC105988445 [Dipodomys ordii]